MKKLNSKLLSLLILSVVITGLLTSHLIKPIEYVKGTMLAKYDLWKGNPKIYVYGLVQERVLRVKYQSLGIELIFRGCLVGNLEIMDKAYNEEISNKLNLLR